MVTNYIENRRLRINRKFIFYKKTRLFMQKHSVKRSNDLFYFELFYL
jgi:hypothetical protein